MGAFLVRWVVVGAVVWGWLWALGALGGGGWSGIAAGMWVGFWNAWLRPVVLRWGGERAWWWLGLGALGLNAVLLGMGRAWGVVAPSVWSSGWAFAGGVLLWSGVSWGLGSVFLDREGRWHFILYHGAPVERRVGSRSRRGGE